MKEIRICMVGSAMTDLIARVPRLPVAGETLIGSSFQVGFGGKGSNQAVMAARLGAKLSVVVKLGKDVFGENYLQNYKDQGIDTRFVSFDETQSSGVAPITVDEKSGQNSIVIVPGANDNLSPEDILNAAPAIQEAEVLICQLETPIKTTLEAFKIARKHHTLTILNPAPARALPDELLSLCDVFVPNEVEAAMLTDQPINTVEEAKTASQTLLKRGPKHVIITLGAKGAVFTSQGMSPMFHAAETVQAVDTTGAGDAFVGSLAYFLAADWPLDKAVARASALATISVQKPGTQSSYPYRQDVLELLDAL